MNRLIKEALEEVDKAANGLDAVAMAFVANGASDRVHGSAEAYILAAEFALSKLEALLKEEAKRLKETN